MNNTASNRFRQLMQQEEQKRMRREMENRNAPSASRSSQMLGAVKLAEGGMVGLPTLEQASDPNFFSQGFVPFNELTAPAFGGMDANTFNFVAPVVQGGQFFQPERGAPVNVDFASTYTPTVNIPGVPNRPPITSFETPILNPYEDPNRPVQQPPPFVQPPIIQPPVTQPTPEGMPASSLGQMFTPGELGAVYDRGSFGDRFSELMQRAPTPEEENYYAGLMAQGATGRDIEREMRDSSAYLDQPLVAADAQRVGYSPGQALNMEHPLVTSPRGSGTPIRQVTAAQVNNILRGLLGGTPDHALTMDVFSRVGSSAQNLNDLSNQVVSALTSGQSAGGGMSEQQRYAAGIGSLLQQNPNATRSDVSAYAQQFYGAPATVRSAAPTPTAPPAAQAPAQIAPPEAAPANPIQALYATHLGRTNIQPEAMAYWTDALNRGASLAEVEQAIATSPEAQARR